MAKKIGEGIGRAIVLLALLGLASCLAPKETPEPLPEPDEPPAITETASVSGGAASGTPTPKKGTVRPATEEELAAASGTVSASIPGVPTVAEMEAAARAEEERLAAEAGQAEEERQAEAARKAEEERQSEAARKAEEERQAEAARKAEEERQAEAARKAEEERQAEAARKAEEARKAADAARASSYSSASNFDTYDNPEQQKTTDAYVINTSTKKIHYPTCRDVKKIAPKNYDTTNESVAELEARGYSPCGHCNPR